MAKAEIAVASAAKTSINVFFYLVICLLVGVSGGGGGADACVSVVDVVKYADTHMKFVP